jgi:2'-hydroxyisoflavone reductase
VIDTCGFLPRVVRSSAQLLAGGVGHYTFVSSVSAYHDFSRPGLTEDTALPGPPFPESEDVERYYDELKAACELEVQDVFEDRCLIVRPGLIVGPHDPTERFTYWVRRLGDRKPVLAPKATEQPVQFIDVRDLAAWMITMVEQQASGAFNATGPASRLTFVRMLDRMRDAIGEGSELVWIEEDQLAGADVQPWDGLPLWLDLVRNPELAGFLDVDISLATANGLEFTDLELTTMDTLAWARTSPVGVIERLGKAVAAPGLTPEREQELLALLRA